MSYSIKRAAVIGAGIMGAGIAAHLANAGIPVLLLDIVPPDAAESTDKAARNRIAQSGLEKALKAKPAPAFYTAKSARLVTVGNTVDDWEQLGAVDLVVEAVVEQLDVKRDTFARLEPVRKPDAIVTSNTSGIPAAQMMAGRGDDFQRHFLITHFFNPVRFLKLLELVPGPQTDPELMRFMGQFATEKLGKGVVYAKDTPNFIGNRIGAYGFLVTLRRMLDEGYTIEEVDAILGPVIGRPRSAAFRTADLAGLDTFAHVVANLYENLPNDPQREVFKLPDFALEMVKRGWIGDKAGQGFYKRIRTDEGKQTLTFDPATLEYRPEQPAKFASIEAVKRNPDVYERIRVLVNSDDRAGKLAWELTANTLLYTAATTPEIADDIVNVDRAMRWGFNWEVGPFETWDALGVEATAKRMGAEGRTLPPLVEEVLGNGTGRFYVEEPRRSYWDFNTHTYTPVPPTGPTLSLAALHKGEKVVKSNGSASLLDMGEGVLCVEFHAKMNAIDADIIAMLNEAVAEGRKNWRAIVVGNDAPDFCVGANLFLVLLGAKSGAWDEIDRGTRALQDANMALKYSDIPVVVAPAGRTLGGGAEIVMHGQGVRAAVETYIGLVEVGAGVVPAGGGCKELLARWQTLTPEQGPFPAVRHSFETIVVATVATSAYDAMSYGFLRKNDAITWDRERLLADAKTDALALAEAKDKGTWRKPASPTFRLPGPGGRLVLEQVAEGLKLQGKASEHDVVVSSHLASVLTGGNCSPLDILSEQDILDLEREAFVELCKFEKTQERMAALLTTGKALRN
jgi:3-hydroxyacyl-CoA dehydrogenase